MSHAPVEQEPEVERVAAKKRDERRRWAELRETYRRCVLIAEDEWRERLDNAQAEQRQLSESMRDRGTIVEVQPTKTTAAYHIKGESAAEVMVQPAVTIIPREIHVGLFTPRDRLQFLKEAAVALLISCDRRNLTATPEPKEEPSGAAESIGEPA